MILIFETGNTTINIAIYNDEIIINKWKIIDKQINNENDFESTLQQLLDISEININNIEIVLISSVVKKLEKIQEEYCKKNNLKFLNIKNKNVNLNFDARETLGADLVANIFAGIASYKKNFIIIDMGTATTFSIVGKNTEHLGEIFVSGIDTTLKALCNNCDLLPQINIKEPKNVIGKTTEEAMLSGIYYGYIGIIKEIIENILNETKEDMKIILTGGYTNTLINKLNFIDYVDEDITFKGIKMIYEYNKNNKKLW